MIKIAILGYGNIGSGVAQVLAENAQKVAAAAGDAIEVKYVLDLRDFPGDPLEHCVVHDINVIVNDPEVSIVAEMMGGSHPAYEFSMAALRAGKSVVTSNKEVVANFGTELLATARENGVAYLFEASVGGGIPIIRPLSTSLSSDDIYEIDGILNGTTNYILTRMFADHVSFDEALKEAQALGYAEANPSADVDGIDAQRKICILSALAFGGKVAPEKIHTETMRTVSSEDIVAASAIGGAVKLIARAKRAGEQVHLLVAPHIVPSECPLSHISDVFNGILVRGSVSGDLLFYGRGAGKLPTAGSVVADIISAAQGNKDEIPVFTDASDTFTADFGTHRSRRYLRLDGDASETAKALGGELLCDKANECLTGDVSEAELASHLDTLEARGVKCLSHLRILD